MSYESVCRKPSFRASNIKVSLTSSPVAVYSMHVGPLMRNPKHEYALLWTKANCKA